MSIPAKHFLLVLFLILLATPTFSDTPESTAESSRLYPLYPAAVDTLPPLPSPRIREDGMETVIAFIKYDKYVLVPVTVTNSRRKGRQLDVDAEDFPTLAKTGLHSEGELRRTKTITGKSISEITAVGRPGQSSNAGFMAEDEDIISVLASDNRLVKKMGLTHPRTAKPLFHVWNMILNDLAMDLWPHHSRWDNFQYIFYNGKKVKASAVGTKGGQGSIFDDEIKGAVDITIHRELEPSERMFLEKKYNHLDEEQMNAMIKKLSTMVTGEMEPYYIQRYGFYEGHTEYRTDPLAIAFIFGLKRIEELEAAFPGRIDKVLRTHFTEPGFERVLNTNYRKPAPASDKEIGALIQQLAHRSWEESVKRLAKIGSPAVVPLIEAMNTSSDHWIAERAAYALGRIQTEKSRDALKAALNNFRLHVRVRSAVAESLGNFKSQAATVVEPLLKVLEGKTKYSNRVRWHAILGLERLQSEKAVEGLLRVLTEDEPHYFKTSAAKLLGKIRSREAVNGLIHVFNSNYWQVWEAAGNALLQIGEPATGALIRALDSPQVRIRRKAAWTLGKMKSERAVPALVKLLRDRDWMVRDEAAVALVRINSPSAVGFLEEASRSKESSVREAAAWVLEKIRS